MTTSSPQQNKPGRGRKARNPFVDSGFFVLRTPLLPVHRYLQWSSGLAAPRTAAAANGPGDALEEAVQADRRELRRRLRAILDEPAPREAVFLASPDLYDAIEEWKRDPESPNGRRAEESLVRYFSRMTFRSTPFGLFAGCSVGRVGEALRLRLSPAREYRRHTRLDMDYLCAVADSLVASPESRSQLRYRPNSSLYTLGGRLRYAESRTRERLPSHRLVAVRTTDYLRATLDRAAQGASFEDLARALVGGAIDLDAARRYVGELVASQILVPELRPRVSGTEPIHAMIAHCETNPATQATAAALSRTRDRLIQIDAEELGVEPERYRAVAQELKDLPPQPDLARLLQTDLWKPAPEAEVNQDVLDQILRGVGILHLVSRSRPRNLLFSNFKRDFLERYGSQEVPLVEVLDEELGIGFRKSQAPGSEPSPLLDGVVFASVGRNLTAWGPRERLLLQLLLDAQERGEPSVELRPEWLGALRGRVLPPMPDAFGAVAVVGARSPQALAQGDFRLLLSGCSGPSGANLMGRFCHVHPQLTDWVKKHIEDEEALDSEAVFAEIVHLPEDRVGNILLRPALRKYEIPLLGQSSQPHENQIPLNDLRVSLRDGEIVLRSKTLGKRVHPRLTTAHGYMNDKNLGLYRFLCCLQWQGSLGGTGWSWEPFQTAAFLPRVTFQKLVLCRAQWLLDQETVRPLVGSQGAERYRKVQALRQERRLPRHVALADADNELVVDLDNILSIDAFLAVVKQRPYFLLKELFPSPQELAVEGPEGAYTAELLVPFVRRQRSTPARSPDPATPTQRTSLPTVTRTFVPGSEWLYAKAFTGTASADEILRRTLGPLAVDFEARGWIDRWFFVRYSDPTWHLRVRFHGRPEVLDREVFPALKASLEPLVESRVMWKLQLDSYQREVERYGGPVGIVAAEKWFHADSRAVVEILRNLKGEELNDARWRLTLKAIDTLLEDLALDVRTKRSLMERASEAYAREFFFQDTPLRHQIGRKFRQERKGVDTLLDPDHCHEHPLANLFPIFEARSRAGREALEELRRAETRGQLTDSVENIALSYVHMTANRLLRSSARAQELLLYSFLYRVYDSQLARLRRRRSRPASKEPRPSSAHGSPEAAR